MASSAPILVISGPSGSGKTTLLRALAGVETRAAGRIAFGGEVWQDVGVFLPPWKRRVGWVPQDGLLFPHLSVRENLGYTASSGIGGVAEALGIAGLLDRYPRNLSGGERQRVAIGRAILANPRLLLLDEPFAALDRATRARVSAWIASWVGEGRMLVLVTHQPEADGIGGEAWEIEDGRLRSA